MEFKFKVKDSITGKEIHDGTNLIVTHHNGSSTIKLDFSNLSELKLLQKLGFINIINNSDKIINEDMDTSKVFSLIILEYRDKYKEVFESFDFVECIAFMKLINPLSYINFLLKGAALNFERKYEGNVANYKGDLYVLNTATGLPIKITPEDRVSLTSYKNISFFRSKEDLNLIIDKFKTDFNEIFKKH